MAGEPLTFGDLLAGMRTTRGLSQGQLAKRAGLDPSSISRLEAGARTPERETILRLSTAMELPVAERDRLLIVAGFRAEGLDDPLVAELAQLLTDPDIPEAAQSDLRAALRVAIQFARGKRTS